MIRKTPTRTVDAEKLKKNLIAYGKKKGHITSEELQELLPPDLIDPAEIGEWESMLVAEGVQITTKEEAKAVSTKAQTKVATRKVMPKRYEKEDEEDEQARTNDPVRMYLRKMGSVALLTREGEVEIAKRIEEGENEVLEAILNSPVAVREIIDIGDRLRNHKIRVKDIVRDAEDEEHEFDEEEADRRIIRLIDRVKRLDKKNQEIIEERKTAVDVRKKAIDKELSDNKKELVKTLQEMRLNKKTIDKIVGKLKSMIDRVQRAQGKALELEKQSGASKSEIKKMLREAKDDPEAERTLAEKLGVEGLAEVDDALRNAQNSVKKV